MTRSNERMKLLALFSILTESSDSVPCADEVAKTLLERGLVDKAQWEAVLQNLYMIFSALEQRARGKIDRVGLICDLARKLVDSPRCLKPILEGLLEEEREGRP